MHDPSEEIFTLWDQLSDFSVGEGDAALTHLLSTLCALFGAQNALWSVVVRPPSPRSGDPLNGWRPRLIRLLKPLPPVAASMQEQFDTLWSRTLDLSQVLAMAGEETFSGDKGPFGLALRGLRWFYRQQLLSHGLLVANAPLTAMERRMLLVLLQSKTEKATAALLAQSPHTTHIHIKSIYAKFGVHNRAALTALWLGRLPQAA